MKSASEWKTGPSAWATSTARPAPPTGNSRPTYTWDARGQLTQLTRPGGTTRGYLIDGDNASTETCPTTTSPPIAAGSCGPHPAGHAADRQGLGRHTRGARDRRDRADDRSTRRTRRPTLFRGHRSARQRRSAVRPRCADHPPNPWLGREQQPRAPRCSTRRCHRRSPATREHRRRPRRLGGRRSLDRSSFQPHQDAGEPTVLTLGCSHDGGEDVVITKQPRHKHQQARLNKLKPLIEGGEWVSLILL
jgi:YD repeat-containing protein